MIVASAATAAGTRSAVFSSGMRSPTPVLAVGTEGTGGTGATGGFVGRFSIDDGGTDEGGMDAGGGGSSKAPSP
jgi:hypothetical protein